MPADASARVHEGDGLVRGQGRAQQPRHGVVQVVTEAQVISQLEDVLVGGVEPLRLRKGEVELFARSQSYRVGSQPERLSGLGPAGDRVPVTVEPYPAAHALVFPWARREAVQEEGPPVHQPGQAPQACSLKERVHTAASLSRGHVVGDVSTFLGSEEKVVHGVVFSIAAQAAVAILVP